MADILKAHCRADRFDFALDTEWDFYKQHVTVLEDEQHYAESFKKISAELAALGKRHRLPGKPHSTKDIVAFVMPAGAMLGHTEVLCNLLEQRGDQECRVYVLHQLGDRLKNRLRQMGVKYFAADEHAPKSHFKRLQWLQKHFRQERIGTLVWVSSPTAAITSLAMRIAPVQVFWTLRFYPIVGQFIDGYITGWGRAEEGYQEHNGQKWKVCPAPLTVEIAEPNPTQVAYIREQYKHKRLIGTLARTEKTNSEQFLRCVARILQDNPDTGFIYAGRDDSQDIKRHFSRAGVLDRTHFVGWVPPAPYIKAMDVFLETFPLGCGVIPYTVLGMGVPFLGMQSPYSVFGNAGQNCPKSEDEYVAKANAMLADDALRQKVGMEGKAFFEREKERSAEYANLFFDTVKGFNEPA